MPAAAFQPTKLLDRPSLAFVHEFYNALANFGAVDVAMAEARRAIQLEEAGAGWGMPQLVSRVRDGTPVRTQGSTGCSTEAAVQPALGVSTQTGKTLTFELLPRRRRANLLCAVPAV